LNAFTLDYREMKKLEYLTVICKSMGPPKRWGQIAATSNYCFIVMYEWRYFSLLHHTDLFHKLRHLFGTFKMIWRLFTNHWLV